MNANEQIRPLVVRLREAKETFLAAVNSAINEQRLPCYLIEPILSEVLTQVRTTATQEYELAKAQMTEPEEGGDRGT